MRLGDLGKDRVPPGDDDGYTFGWFGLEVRVNPEGSTDLAFVDFLEHAMGVDEEDPQSALIVKQYLRDVIHPDDFDEFWKLAREHRQTTEDLMVVAAEVVSGVIGRPIQPSSDSGPGTSPIGVKSKDGSYLRAMERLKGRPDLQNVVAMSAEREARRAG